MKMYLQLIAIIALNASLAFSQDFTLGVMPDIQNMSQSDIEALKVKKMTQHFIDNKTALNLQMVVSLGDNVYGYSTDAVMEAEYKRIKPAVQNLTNAGIPYAPCAGNHDGQPGDHEFKMFNKYFPISEMKAQNPYLNDNLNGSANTSYLFSASGMDFVMVIIEPHDQFITGDFKLDYDLASIKWADSIFKVYPNRRGIFATHDFFEPSGNKLINDLVKKNDNIFLSLCGHSCSRQGFNGMITGEYAWDETTNGGHSAKCILSNYQCDADKGATVRYYTFKPTENKVYAYSYNVVNNAFRTNASSQFSFDYNMNGSGISISLAQTSAIYEGQEHGKTITVKLTKAQFVSSLNASYFTISNLPTGVSIGAITRNSDTLVTIALNGNSTIGTYTSDITNVGVNVAATAIVNGKISVMANSGIVLSKAPQVVPGKIESESYTAMLGVQLENTTDVDGGKNIGYLNPNDWFSYTINVATAGKYMLAFRNASMTTNGSLQMQINNIAVKTFDFTLTGGWQTWQTSTFEVDLSAGIQELKFVVLTGDFNINWFEFTADQVVTGSNETVNQPAMILYPNPVNELLQIKNLPENSTVHLLNLLGVEIKSFHNQTMDVSDIPAGIYFAKVKDQTFWFSKCD